MTTMTVMTVSPSEPYIVIIVITVTGNDENRSFAPHMKNGRVRILANCSSHVEDPSAQHVHMQRPKLRSGQNSLQ